MGLSNQNSNFIKQVLFLVALSSIMYFIPNFIGLGKGGFDLNSAILPTSRFAQFTYYLATGLISAFIVCLLILVERFVIKGDIIYGNGLGFYSPNDHPHTKLKVFGKPFQLLLICIIIFGILGLIVGVTKQSFFGVGAVQQQFTKFDNINFNATLVAISENLGVAAIAAISIFSVRYFARAKKWSRNTFMLVAWIATIIVVTLYGVSNHQLRYGFNDYNLLNIAGIWFVGAVITMFSGSFIPFLTLHIVNNVFFDAGKLFSADQTRIFTIGIIIAAVLLYGFIYVFLASRRGNKNET